MEKVKVIQINSELGAGTRGSSLGSRALEIAAWKARSDFFRKHLSTVVQDENQLLYEETNTPHAKYIEGIIKVHERSSDLIFNTLTRDNDFPVVLIGDHSSSAGTIAGVKMAHPDKRLGIIWVDAHGDMHSPYSTPSGNMHGMPLAVVLNLNNEKFRIRDPQEKTLLLWEALKNHGGIAPKALPEDVVFFGVRDVEEAEQYLMENGGMKNFCVDEIRQKGVAQCVAEALKKLNHCDLIYLSFDVDSMDCNLVSMGTGTPVPNGLTPEEAEEILIRLVKSGKVGCFDMVEINPTLDNKGNLMAETAFRILCSVTNTIEEVLNQKREIAEEDGN